MEILCLWKQGRHKFLYSHFTLLEEFFITSYESDVVIPYVTTGRNPFVPIYYRLHSSTIEKFGKLIFASAKSVESPGRDESCVLLDPDDESLQVAEKNYSLH